MTLEAASGWCARTHNEVIAPMFAMIGTDYAVATRKQDADQQRKLLALVVALEETYPDRPSLFSGPIGRGQARFISEWVPVWSRPMFMTVVKDVFDHIHQEDKAYFRESREKRFGKTLEELHAERDKHHTAIETGLEPLRAVLQVQPYICGDAPAYGDYIVFGSFQMARSMSPYKVLEKDDILYDWRKRMLDLYDRLGRSVNAYPE